MGTLENRHMDSGDTGTVESGGTQVQTVTEIAADRAKKVTRLFKSKLDDVMESTFGEFGFLPKK